MKSKYRSIPFVAQVSEVDCGAACLAMSLRCLGVELPLETIHKAVGVARDGVNALHICEGAQSLGFQARAVRVDLDTLKYLRSGAILHWEMEHFVVFERIVRDGIVIVDPSNGSRRVEWRELDVALSGVAIIVDRGTTTMASAAAEKPAQEFWWSALKRAPELPRAVVGSLGLQLLVGVFPLLSGAVVDRVVPRGDYRELVILSVALLLLCASFASLTYVRGRLLADLRTHLDLAGATNLINHLVSLPASFFQLRSPGDLLVRVRSNEVLREALGAAVLASLLDGVIVLVYLVALVLLDWRMAMATAVLIGLLVAMFLAQRRRHKELVAESQHRQGVADGHLVDLLTGIETLKVAGAEQRAVAVWVTKYVDVLNASLRRFKLTLVSEVFLSTVRTVGPFVVLLVGVRAVLAHELSLGSLVAGMAFAHGIILSISTLLSSVNELDALTALIGRLDDILRTRPETSGREPAHELLGAVRFDAVSYKPSERSEPIVQDISFEIPAGSFVAFVGPSGSGKSTIAGLIAGLIPPSSGRILFDQHDSAELEIGSVRRQMGIVVQKPQMFGQSIRENITMMQDLPMSVVEDAARAACIHDDIAAMGMQYLTPLVAGGAIAGGQRQRISLARALVRKPRILVLDEATSSLDTITEHRIFENIKRMGCTRIVIAHRLSTIKDADMIFCFQGGRIVETGTHASLRKQGGLYAQLLVTHQDPFEGDDRPSHQGDS